jgi:predicted phage tail protein
MTRKKKGMIMSVTGVLLLVSALVLGTSAACNAYVTNKTVFALADSVMAIVIFAIGLHLFMKGMEYIIIPVDEKDAIHLHAPDVMF